MFNGTISLRATMRGTGIKFPSFDYAPNEPGVDHITIEAPDGEHIQATVYVVNVATVDDGLELAAKVLGATLDRLAYHYKIAIEKARVTGDHFTPANPEPGTTRVIFARLQQAQSIEGRGTLILPISVVQPQLAGATAPGERYFALFRSALLSTSTVEAYMHLYNLLLMLHNDRQADLDAFVVREEPGVPQTQNPMKKSGVMETVYTRLRNEFAHVRPSVKLAITKQEMTHRLGGLRHLTQRAIELHP